MKLQKYEKYKDSRVAWLGKIPEEWEVKKLKYVVNMIRTGTTPSTQNPNFFDGNIDWFNPKDLNQSMLKNAEKKVSNLAIERKEIKLFPANSILIVGIGATTGKTAYLAKNATFNQQITGFKSFTHKNKFLFYLLKNSSKIFLKIANYTTLPILNNEFFKSYILPIPPLHEQTKIADFLDQKTAQIDKAISLKEQLIEKLKEYRQILINNAVTKGLDKNVKMKDSEVAWIGEIPEHWEVLPGFRIYKENKTKNTGMMEEQVLSLSYGEIVIKPKEKLTGLVPESFETYQIVKPNDIIIRCMDLQNDKTSLRTGIAKDAGIITSAYLNLNVIHNFNAEYLHYYLHTLDITKVLYKFGTGLRQNLSYEDFKRLPILVPPPNEQEMIVLYIKNQTQKIDKAISQQQKQIDKLKEYKASLIDSVVTGKVKVS